MRVSKIKLGNGFDQDTEMGPVISTAHRDKIEGYMEVAKKMEQQLQLVVNALNVKTYKPDYSLNLL